MCGDRLERTCSMSMYSRGGWWEESLEGRFIIMAGMETIIK
jgi:hypothetical protein